MESFEFDYRYDFSLLSAIDLQRDKINFGEIISVFENPLTVGELLSGFPAQGPLYSLIGFSTKKRFLLVALEYYDDKVIFLQIQVADEQYIRTGYCGKPN